jgi:hypothetical protein
MYPLQIFTDLFEFIFRDWHIVLSAKISNLIRDNLRENGITIFQRFK